MTTSVTSRLALAGLLSSVSFSALAQTTPKDEIIVTGSPLVRSIDEAITGTSILTGDELQDRLAGTIGETLKSEPGVSSTFFGAGASRPIIRGQGGDRVRVLTNGIGSIDASSASPDHAVAAEPAQAERIEVVRGASVLRYGSSGAGGIVNVIDGRVPSELPEQTFSGAFRLGASSVDNGIETAASLDTKLGANLVLHVDGTFKKTDDYSIPGLAESARQIALEEAEEEEQKQEQVRGQVARGDAGEQVLLEQLQQHVQVPHRRLQRVQGGGRQDAPAHRQHLEALQRGQPRVLLLGPPRS